MKGHVDSMSVVSAVPAICPRLLISLACPLFPPSVGRALIWPSCQRNGRHVSPVPRAQTSSPSGSGTNVSDIPTACPRSLIPPQFIQVFVFGPPREPRSILSSPMLIVSRAGTGFTPLGLLLGRNPFWVNAQP